jgi:LDH2 family malate/lactate/ureidoglycolate dehydrogenase
MMADERGAVRLVRIDNLRGALVAGFRRLGLSAEHADGIAALLLDAELRGHPDHGVARLGYLADWYREGSLNPRPNVRVLRETDGALLLDGDRGCGLLAAEQAMRWCIQRAKIRQGMAIAGVRNWQCFTGGPFVRLAAEADCIGFACINSRPFVAPPGGASRVLGTNPLAYGIPAGRHAPFIFDMATTASAFLKVLRAAEAGQSIASGLVLDRSGRPTDDPRAMQAGGSMAPLGAPFAPHKGFALAQVVDVLAGVLTGSGFAQTIGPENGTGCTFWALDVEAFLPREAFLARIDQQIDQIKQAERREGAAEIQIPGEHSEQRYRDLLARGEAPISAESWAVFSQACAALGVAPPEVEA